MCLNVTLYVHCLCCWLTYNTNMVAMWTQMPFRIGLNLGNNENLFMLFFTLLSLCLKHQARESKNPYVLNLSREQVWGEVYTVAMSLLEKSPSTYLRIRMPHRHIHHTLQHQYYGVLLDILNYNTTEWKLPVLWHFTIVLKCLYLLVMWHY